jgi:hypothetical protein
MISIFILKKFGLTTTIAQKTSDKGLNILDFIIDRFDKSFSKTATYLKVKRAVDSMIADNKFLFSPFEYVEVLIPFGLKSVNFLTKNNLFRIEEAKNIILNHTKNDNDFLFTKNNSNKFVEAHKYFEKYAASDKDNEIAYISIFWKLAKKGKLNKNDLLNMGIDDSFIEEMLSKGYLFEMGDFILVATKENRDIFNEFKKIKELEKQKKLFEDMKKNPSEAVKEYRKTSNLLDLEECLLNLDDNIGTLRKRLSGKTLEEIAKPLNLSREMVRQKQAKLILLFPKLQEDVIFKELFQTYEISLESFLNIFKENEKVFNYLKLRYSKGDKELFDWIISSEIPKNQKEDLIKIENKYLSYDGSIKDINRVNFIGEILFENRKKINYFTQDFLKEKYNQYVLNRGYKNLYVENARSLFQSAEKSDFSISTRNGKIRFHDNYISKDVQKELVDVIESYDDGIYSMRKVVEENKDLMEEIDIRDGYELHNLFRRFISCEVIKKYGRSPEFQIGHNSKKTFILNKIKESAGISSETFANQLQKDYGLLNTSTMAYISSNFRKYIGRDKIIESSEIIPEDKSFYKIMKNKLGKNVYLYKDITNLIAKLGYDYPASQLILNECGYRFSGKMIWKNNFPNISAAFTNEILSNHFYEIKDEEIYKTIDFFSVMSRLEREFKVIRISSNKIVKTEFLEQQGLNLSLIPEFIKNVKKYINYGEYFSLYSLIESGFNNNLLDYGFEPIAYERILMTDREIRPVNRTGMIVFQKTRDRPTLEKFYSDILSSVGIMDEFDFKEDINTKFGTNFELDEIRNRLTSYGAYYSRPLNKFYFDKEDYLNEVYGR